jgi:hypothetical protein
MALRKKADPDYAKSIRRLVPAKMPIIGVRVPVIRSLVREFAKANSSASITDVVGLLDDQFVDGSREEVLFGIFLLNRYKRSFDVELWKRLKPWVPRIENWEI